MSEILFCVSTTTNSFSIHWLNYCIISPLPWLTKMAMNKFKKSQILMLSLLAALLLIAPLLSSSLRPTYLYFVLNFLIISLGVEAGLLSFFSRPLEENRKAFKPIATKESSTLEPDDKKQVASSECSDKKTKVVEKSASEKIAVAVKVEKVKKCPSMPSLFFIGGGEAEAEDVVEEYEEEEDELGEQELFAKAETFIGNFYKQLKMQREESWTENSWVLSESLLSI